MSVSSLLLNHLQMQVETKKILIVEDNPGDLFLVNEFLRRTSFSMYEKVHADSMKDAIGELQNNTFQIILLDLYLPDSDGLDTFDTIFPLSGSAPVIVLTGLVDENITMTTLKKGAQDYIVKGEYDEKLLEKTIRYAIERKQNQELVKKSEEEYKLLFEGNPIPMMAIDIETLRITTVNDACVQFYGYSREEFGKLTIRDIRPPEDLMKLDNELVRLREFSNGLVKSGEWRHTRKDGSIVYVEIVSHGLMLGGVRARLVASYDVTERRKAEEYLRLLESAITNTNDSVVITEAHPGSSSDTPIIFVNSAFIKMTGYTAEEVVGKSPRILQGPKTDQREINRIRQALASWKSIEVELVNYKKDGTEFWVSLTLVPIADEAGHYTHWVSIQRDVTARRRLEEFTRQKLEKQVEERTRELNKALEKEKELVDLKSKFVSIASHEFRTPLASISFAAESIRNYFHQLSSKEIQQKLIKIEEQVSHMTNLLEDILTIGKSDAGQIKVKRVSLDLKEFIQSIIEEVQMPGKVKRTIYFNFNRVNAMANVDEKLLRNVTINLLTNALKFSSENDPVTITITDHKDGFLMEVKDEGLGIDAGELQSVFEPFQRGSNVSNVQGTGLGLSILKKAVDLMNGSIEVESELNKGSLFKVYIPVQ